MTRSVVETERERHDRAIGVWDIEESGSVRTAGDEQYGRRIEADRSWTIYHVFTGVPAAREGMEMIGLSRSVATDGMLSMNRRNGGYIKDRGSLTARGRRDPHRTKVGRQ
ncbi:hypothetical protein [Neoaquamicrobium microcysteis]|uniref:hypothetical protein n=1 Tax=Neoaquamicrobium microcysteis TaxID=2682781 RepID=UPI001F3E07A9|nr:hypothetical protein [Mesorhizobium microcysteis]